MYTPDLVFLYADEMQVCRRCLPSEMVNLQLVSQHVQMTSWAENFITNFLLKSPLPRHWLIFGASSKQFYLNIHTLTFPDLKQLGIFAIVVITLTLMWQNLHIVNLYNVLYQLYITVKKL